MKLLEALIYAARFSVNPTFSLFSVSSKGEYDLVESLTVTGVFGSTAPETKGKAEQIVELFKAESLKEVFGLEVRCNGVRVEFTGT